MCRQLPVPVHASHLPQHREQGQISANSSFTFTADHFVFIQVAARAREAEVEVPIATSSGTYWSSAVTPWTRTDLLPSYVALRPPEFQPRFSPAATSLAYKKQSTTSSWQRKTR